MKKFLDNDFLLNNDVAVKLYRDYAQNMPIIDYHCHLDPKEIAQNKKFETITEAWLGGDHYKWRLMRACGVEEKYITGSADDKDKFFKWAGIMPKLIGNPIYQWAHMELRKYFGYDGVLCPDTAQEVWNVCNSKLKSMGAQDFITESNVKVICTTDDPIDSLEYHDAIRQENLGFQVLPTWRPDKILNIDSDGFSDYLTKLADVCQMDITDIDTLKKALKLRMNHFASMGCVISDHSLAFVMYQPADSATINDILNKKIQGDCLTDLEILQYKTSIMMFLAKEYYDRNWTMQLHYGVMRNNNSKMFDLVGVDGGFDCICDPAPLDSLAKFLDALSSDDTLPKTILYSLYGEDNTAIDTLIGCFQEGEALGKIQHGAAWWFNDNKDGIINHMKSLASQGVLGNFIGMLTDSRSFLSYTRHEYFRRILCNFLGEMVEQGEYPQDYKALGSIVQDICFGNANRYLGFNL